MAVRKRFQIPTGFVVSRIRTDPARPGRKPLFASYRLFLRPDIEEWCKEHRIKYWNIKPQAMFMDTSMGAPYITMRSKDAVHFKLMWF